MGELWLLRHAEPQSPGLYIGRGSDPSLSARGEAEAERIAAVLATGNDIPEIICSSPLKRARETVDPLARILNIHVENCIGMAELDFGDWEGLDWKEIEEEDGELWKAWLDNPYRIAPPGGETLENLMDRVVCEIDGILERHHGRRILIASHGGPIRTVLGYALGLDPSSWWSVAIDYASLSRFSRPSPGQLNLLQWNVPIQETIETEL